MFHVVAQNDIALSSLAFPGFDFSQNKAPAEYTLGAATSDQLLTQSSTKHETFSSKNTFSEDKTGDVDWNQNKRKGTNHGNNPVWCLTAALWVHLDV